MNFGNFLTKRNLARGAVALSLLGSAGLVSQRVFKLSSNDGHISAHFDIANSYGYVEYSMTITPSTCVGTRAQYVRGKGNTSTTDFNFTEIGQTAVTITNRRADGTRITLTIDPESGVVNKNGEFISLVSGRPYVEQAFALESMCLLVKDGNLSTKDSLTLEQKRGLLAANPG